MLFLALNRYHPIWNGWFSSLFYYVVLLFLMVLIFLRKNPLDYGLRWGKAWAWLKYVRLFCLVATPLLFLFSFVGEYQQYYKVEQFAFLTYFLINFASLFGSAFIVQGFRSI